MNWINLFGSSNCVNFRNFWYRMYGWFTTSYLLEFRQIVYEIREVWKRCPPDNRYITITSLDSRDQLKIILLPSNLHPLFTHTRRTETFDNTVDRIFRNIRVIEHDFISSNDERNRIEERIDWEERISRFERRGSVPSPPPPSPPPPPPPTRVDASLFMLGGSRSGLRRQPERRKSPALAPPPGHHWLAALTPSSPPLSPTEGGEGKRREIETYASTPTISPPLLLSFFLSISILLLRLFTFIDWSNQRVSFRFVSFACLWKRHNKFGVEMDRCFSFQSFLSFRRRIERNSRGNVGWLSSLYRVRMIFFFGACSDEGR